MKTHRLEYRIAAFTKLKVGIVLHSSFKAMHKELTKLENEVDETVKAFCHFPDKPVAGGALNPQVCTLHFCPEFLAVPIIAHEAVHAALQLGRIFQLDQESNTGEELLAETCDHLVDCVFDAAKQAGFTVRRRYLGQTEKASTRL